MRNESDCPKQEERNAGFESFTQTYDSFCQLISYQEGEGKSLVQPALGFGDSAITSLFPSTITGVASPFLPVKLGAQALGRALDGYIASWVLAHCIEPDLRLCLCLSTLTHLICS